MARHCSYCYNTGHNRATCPDIKKQIKDNPDGFLARRANLKKERKQVRGPSNRVCGYCSKTGHNKRTCESLTHDRADRTRKNRKFRRDFITMAKNIGFGLGSLVQVADPSVADRDYGRREIERLHEYYGALGMVVGLDEKLLNADLHDNNKYLNNYDQAVVHVRFPNGKKTTAPLPKEFEGLVLESDMCKQGYWSIGCAVNADGLDDYFSESFTSGEAGVEHMLGLED